MESKVKFTVFVAHAKSMNPSIDKMILKETKYKDDYNHLTLIGKDTNGVVLFEKIMVKSVKARELEWTVTQYATDGSMYFKEGKDEQGNAQHYIVIGRSSTVSATYGEEVEV